MSDKILLVDDEKDIVDLLEETLCMDGSYEIRRAYTGGDALRICNEFAPDVIILDIMLPDIDGLEVCRQIRGFSYCSILFLSSRDDDIDKILGLSGGGDDYITKPFSPREVAFRVKAQLRRQKYQDNGKEQPEKPLTAGRLTIDREGCRCLKMEMSWNLPDGNSFYCHIWLRMQEESSARNNCMRGCGGSTAASAITRLWSTYGIYVRR